MSIHRTQGVVLRTRKIRESSLIVVFFTRDYGKISVVAKGSLRPKSKFGSSLELFTRSSLIFYKKENRDLHTLSHSDILSSHKELKKDVVKVAYASVTSEMVERLVPGEEPNKQLYLLLDSALKQIELAERQQLEVVLTSYVLKMLHLVGYGPELTGCVLCGKAVGDKTWFGLVSGGILCRQCHGHDLNAVETSQEALELMRKYECEPLEELRQAHAADAVTREISDILGSFVRTHVGEGGKIKSLDFLERMRDGSYA
ncbi:MAG: DNA repair protein RecO [Candidatus Eisenbacteria bacterium]